MGVLVEQGGCMRLAAHRMGGSASRSTMLLAMRANKIELPDYDMIREGRHVPAIPVQRFCAYVVDAGGVEKVGR